MSSTRQGENCFAEDEPGKSASSIMNRRLQLRVPAVRVSVRETRNAVARLAVDLGAGPSLVEDVRLCVSEAVTNVVRHAYHQESGELEVEADARAGELVVVIRDEGVGMSEFHREGELGYGLRIIEVVSDRCSVSSTPSLGTRVEMAFLLDRSAEESPVSVGV